MYVDESGDTGLVNSPTGYFVLSGIIVHESRWREFLNTLIGFRKTLKGVYGLPLRVEIHASEFITRRPYDLPKHVRLSILRNTLDELAKLEYISITNVVINKTNKKIDYDVFDFAWRTLFQRFENTMIHGNLPGGHRNDNGIIITDATAGQNLLRIVRKMAVHNYIPNDARFNGGARNIPITRIIEDPHGKNSEQTYPIQMCDVVAYFLQQKFAPNSYIRRKRAEAYFDRLLPVLNLKASRFDKLGLGIVTL